MSTSESGNIIETSWRFLEEMVEYWSSGGWPLVPLALIAALMFYRYFLLRRRLKEALSTPSEAIHDFESSCEDEVAPETLRQESAELPGAMARITRHTMARISADIPFREAFEQSRDAELSRFSPSFFILTGLVAAAPLLGLLGTVFGMMETFRAVGQASSDIADQMADGISKALITTQAGLVIALPGTFGLAHLCRLFQRLQNQADHWESHLKLIINGPAKPEA